MSPTSTIAKVALVATLAVCLPAQAYPTHTRMFRQHYARSVGCQLCHEVDDTQRNPFGEGWAKAGGTAAAFLAMEPLDSDGDGALDGAEIKAGSNPGKKTSTPESPGKFGLATPSTFIPVEPLRHIFGDARRIEASEVELSKDMISRAESRIGHPLDPSLRWLDLYFAVEEGRRTSVALFIYAETQKAKFVAIVGLDSRARVLKSVVLSSGKLASGPYARYLSCFQGKAAADLPAPSDCAPTDKQGLDGPTALELRGKVREALETLSIALARRT
ncbi:MAG: hypothetical protein HY791_03215 [Deltaproteobacteria bacterium]|nr:hypothetical protein [Deltaproteobacteria bacterium]